MKFMLIAIMIITAFAIMSDEGRLVLEILISVALSAAFALTLLSRYQNPKTREVEKQREGEQKAED